jgi:Asp/Glu/hydantoin racemase
MNAAPAPAGPDPALGILMLETRFMRIPGDVGHAATWPFPVLWHVVPGAAPGRVVLDQARGLLPGFVAGARALAARGVGLITTSCGFLALFQAELSAAVDVPVATSALLQVPWLQSTLPPGRRVGVITASAASLTPAHFAAVGAPADTPTAGLEGTELHRVLVGEEAASFDVARARADVAEAGRRLVARHPEVASIVLECTNLPPYAHAVRAATGMPVHDIVSMILWLRSGLRPRTFAAPAAR